jgi:hypothetical protein
MEEFESHVAQMGSGDITHAPSSIELYLDIRKLWGCIHTDSRYASSYWDPQQWSRRDCKLGNIISRRTENKNKNKQTPCPQYASELP